MAEKTPELRRVTIELHPEQLPSLLSVLGEFAINNNIELIEIKDADSTSTEPSIRLEKAEFNPKLISWVNDEEEQKRIPVIMLNNMKEFSLEKTGSTTIGTRVFKAMSNLGGRIMRDSPYSIPVWKPYLYKDLGLRADRLPELVTKLQNGIITFLPPNMGNASMDLLIKLNEELYLKES